MILRGGFSDTEPDIRLSDPRYPVFCTGSPLFLKQNSIEMEIDTQFDITVCKTQMKAGVVLLESIYYENHRSVEKLEFTHHCSAHIR